MLMLRNGLSIAATANRGPTNGQIEFPSSANASTGGNVLDTYDENTWTPTLKFGGGSTGMTYSTREGYYIKIGRVVHLFYYILLSAKGSSTGNASLDSMPFTCANDSYGQGGGSPCTYYTGMSAGTTYFSAMRTEKNTTYSWIWAPGAGAANIITDASFTNTSGILGQITYEAAS